MLPYEEPKKGDFAYFTYEKEDGSGKIIQEHKKIRSIHKDGEKVHVLFEDYTYGIMGETAFNDLFTQKETILWRIENNRRKRDEFNEKIARLKVLLEQCKL